MAETHPNQPKSKLLSAQHTLLTAEDLWKQPKVDEWLNAGCAMVWVVNPRWETVEVYRSPEDMTVLRGDDILEGGDVIEGFQCYVRDLFVWKTLL